MMPVDHISKDCIHWVMKTASSSSLKAKTARPKTAAKSVKRPKLNAAGLSWLLNRELPAQDQLPENPVLVLRRS
jgi:hypothetical protein